MTKKEFIENIRALADDLESGEFHIMNIGKNTILCNQNSGEVWVKLTEDTTIRVHLYSSTEEERKEAEERRKK